MKLSSTFFSLSISAFVVASFLVGCATTDPDETDVVLSDTVDAMADTTGLAIDSLDTIPQEIVVLPTDTTVGEFLGLDISAKGDYLKMKLADGSERSFYFGVLPNGNPLLSKEYSYKNRRVAVYWKKGVRFEPMTETYASEDSIVSVRFGDFSVTIGQSGNLDSLPEVLKTLRDGDTLKIAEGTYNLKSALEFWGMENIVVTGDGEVELICEDMNDNVIWIFNSENITLRNIKARHTDPPATAKCTGNVIGIDGCENVTIENCDINGCGAIGVYTFISSGITLRDNHIHNNSLFAVQHDGVGLQAATDSLAGIRFIDNMIENNGHGWGTGAEAVPDSVIEGAH